MCVYKIENKITNDIYVGSAINLTKRKYYHLYDLKNNKHHSIILQNSYNKYGEENFGFSILEEVYEKENLIIREQYHIDTLNPKFNCSKIAGSPLGVKHTLQARLNMSEAHKKLTKEQRNHKDTCKCFICLKITPTNYWLGKKRSLDTKQKLSIPIIQCDMEGNEIKEWFGASEAANELGLYQSHITACCKKLYGRKSIGGFKWKYK